MHDVFISYKAEEINEAKKVRDFLQENGIKCWMAPDSIPGGSSYAAEINAAIKNCRAFILILSPLAQTSIHVTREYSLADKNRKPVLPFCIEYCNSFSDDFEYLLSVTQYYTAYENWEKAADKLLFDLKQKLGIDTLNDSDLSDDIPSKDVPTRKDNAVHSHTEQSYQNKVTSNPNEKRTVFNNKSKNNATYITKSGYSKNCINTLIMGIISFCTACVLSLCIPTVLTFIYAYRAKAQLFEYPELKGRGILKLGLIINLAIINFVIFAIVGAINPFFILPSIISLVISIAASIVFMYIYNNK